jgi:hypothetical protein
MSAFLHHARCHPVAHLGRGGSGGARFIDAEALDLAVGLVARPRQIVQVGECGIAGPHLLAVQHPAAACRVGAVVSSPRAAPPPGGDVGSVRAQGADAGRSSPSDGRKALPLHLRSRRGRRRPRAARVTPTKGAIERIGGGQLEHGRSRTTVLAAPGAAVPPGSPSSADASADEPRHEARRGNSARRQCFVDDRRDVAAGRSRATLRAIELVGRSRRGRAAMSLEVSGHCVAARDCFSTDLIVRSHARPRIVPLLPDRVRRTISAADSLRRFSFSPSLARNRGASS